MRAGFDNLIVLIYQEVLSPHETLLDMEAEGEANGEMNGDHEDDTMEE
jgi:hypothetical protein